MPDDYVECAVCEFGYFTTDPAASGRHQHFHSLLTEGSLIKPGPDDRILARFGGFEVLEGTTDMPSMYRRRLASVAYRANYDMRDFPTAYDGGDEDREYDGRIYVVRKGDRGVGMLVMRRRSPTWWISWDAYNSPQSHPVKQDAHDRWTVDRVWLLASMRGRGLAAHLIRMVAGRLGTSVADLAWLGEFTSDGERFLRRAAPEGFWYHR